MGFEFITGPNFIVPPSSVAAATAAVGYMLQTQYTETTSFITGTSTMAGGFDTVPIKTDGTQIISLSITPKSTGNNLLITALIPVANTGVVTMWIALFQDLTTSALAAMPFSINASNSIVPTGLSYQLTAGTTGPTTFKINVGNFNTVTSTW